MSTTSRQPPSPQPMVWWLKVKRAMAIMGIVAACALFISFAWTDRWVQAGVMVPVAALLCEQLRRQREAQCPNNLCNHDYALHALNLSNQWVWRFDGCFCGRHPR